MYSSTQPQEYINNAGVLLKDQQNPFSKIHLQMK